jgi:hypothetical protein
MKGGFLDAVKQKAQGLLGKAAFLTEGTFSFWYLLIILALFIVGVVVYATQSSNLITAEAIRNKVLEAQRSPYINAIDKAKNGRKYLSDYLASLPVSGELAVPEDKRLLGNFHINTVNCTGMFYVGGERVFSPAAVEYAVKAGARGFVFDLSADIEPQGEFGPLLQVLDPNSSWRRMSMNCVQFSTALETLVQSLFGGRVGLDNKVQQDTAVLYLRLPPSAPPQFYKRLAVALNKWIEPYRLDATFNACRKKSILHATRMSDIAGKIVVLCNVTTITGADELNPYINGVPLEYTLQTIRNMTPDMKLNEKQKISGSLTFLIESSTETSTFETELAYEEPISLGIHSVAMNLLGPVKKTYGDVFGTYSYRIKPAALWAATLSTEPAGSAGNQGHTQSIG